TVRSLDGLTLAGTCDTWHRGFTLFSFRLHSVPPHGILLLYPSSSRSSVDLPSGVSCRKGYMTATFCKGPGMRPMPGLRASRPSFLESPQSGRYTGDVFVVSVSSPVVCPNPAGCRQRRA